MKKILKYCFNTSSWTPTRLEWINLLSSILSDERERVTRYAFKNDAKQTLIGHLLIRYCLKKLLNIEWNQLVIDRNSKGRPYLKIKDTLNAAKLNSFDYHLDFNVSHSGDYTIIVAGTISKQSSSSSSSSSIKIINDDSDDTFRIGTDVMKIDVQRSRAISPDKTEEMLFENELQLHQRLINSRFSNIEKNYIYNRPNSVEKLTAFYRLWCLKESYIKALGDGMGFDIKRIECVANSELLIDLNSKKYIVVDDSQVFIDGKLEKNSKFYEQYFMTLEPTQNSEKPKLHVMTICLMQKEKKEKEQKSSKSKSTSSESTSNDSNDKDEIMEEFVELNVKDILNSMVILEKIDDNNSDVFEDLWLKYSKKLDKPNQ